jgi:1-acyl-sn-glycerol-3-phosphate acyltransferase
MMELHSSNHICQQAPERTPANAKVAPSVSQVSPWLSPLAYILGRNLLLPLFFKRIKITGKENLPPTGPVILAPNHRARWDALLIPYAACRTLTGYDMRFMITNTECQGFQGWFVRRLGGFPVDIKHPSISTLRHGVELLQQEKTLVIFPEGGIFRDRELHPLKPGIARLALSAESSHPGLGVKILPISIKYSHPYPRWGTDVSIDIGSAMKVSDYISGCAKRDAKNLTIDLAKALEQLMHEESQAAPHGFLEISH